MGLLRHLSPPAWFLFLASCVLANCSARVRIGVVLPETGEAAVYGMPIKSGIRLAMVENLPGVATNLEFVFRDSGSDPSRAALATESLFTEGATLIIGGATSSEALAMIPVINRWHRPLISPSASAPELARKSQYFFRVYPSDDLEGTSAAIFLTKSLNASKILILSEDNDYTRGLLPVFIGELRQQNGRVVDSVKVGDIGWENATRRALSFARPDGIYVCTYPSALIAAMRLLKTSKYTGVICVTSAACTGPVIERSGTVLEGVVFPRVAWDEKNKSQAMVHFFQSYLKSYGMEPDIFAIHGHEAGILTRYTLSRADGRDGHKLVNSLRSQKGVDGMLGVFDFDEFGNIKRRLGPYWIHNGRVVPFPLPAQKTAFPGQGGH